MTTDDRDDSSLRDLFERTAHEASVATLGKLRSRAAEIPKRRPGNVFRNHWLWMSGALGFAAAAAALVLVASQESQRAPGAGSALRPTLSSSAATSKPSVGLSETALDVKLAEESDIP